MARNLGLLRDKRGVSKWFKITLEILGLIAILGLIVYFGSKNIADFKVSVSAKHTVKDVLNVSAPGVWGGVLKTVVGILGFAIGTIPDSLYDELGGVSSLIVIFAIELMLAITFYEVLFTFSLFRPITARIVAILFTIIIINLKLVLYIAAWMFSLVGIVGVLSIGFGILVPFLLFIYINFILLSDFRKLREKKLTDRFVEGARRGRTKARVGLSVLSGIAEEAEKAGKGTSDGGGSSSAKPFGV